MNESLLNGPAEAAKGEEISFDADEKPIDGESMRPEGMPEKFWDRENGTVRIDALTKSYRELERKLGGAEAQGIPESAEGYEITIGGNPIESDADVNNRLHAAGMTQDQVQTVYELANEKLMPVLTNMTASFEADNQTERLISHFGGNEKWTEARRQIGTWGRENFSEDIFAALSGTYEGVLTMQRMMSGNEPGLGRADASGFGPSEKTLKTIMDDPRYWRERDPAYVERVRQGFRNLYPGN